MTGLERPICADWLALRRAADEQARVGAEALLARLADHLRQAGAAEEEPVTVVDLGAGTGANPAFLAPRLPFPTSWVLVDHDPALLNHQDGSDSAARERRAPGPTAVRRVQAEVEDLASILAAETTAGSPRIVTGSALLDLLTPSQVSLLVDALVAHRTPALFSLTVTGEVRLDPADPEDDSVRSAFDAHQSRGERLGPRAAAAMVSAARAAGLEVHQAATPWVLDASAPQSRVLLARYLTDRAEAASAPLEGGCPAPFEEGSAASLEGASHVDEWLVRRLSCVEAGVLRVVVDHCDLLLLPPHQPQP